MIIYCQVANQMSAFLNLLKGVNKLRDLVDENLYICGVLNRFDITTNVSSFL